MYYQDNSKYIVDFIYSNKPISGGSYVLLPDGYVGKVLKFSDGVICKTKDGDKKFQYKELKSILLFVTEKFIYINSTIIKDGEFFVVEKIDGDILSCVDYKDDKIEFNKSDVKKFYGIVKSDNLFQVGDKISGIENNKIFTESVYGGHYCADFY